MRDQLGCDSCCPGHLEGAEWREQSPILGNEKIVPGRWGKERQGGRDDSRTSPRALMWESGLGVMLLTKIRTREGMSGERMSSL